MAHFVKVNSQSIVEAVYVIANNELLDEDGNEDEARGINFCKRLFGSGTYLQTSYNNNRVAANSVMLSANIF